MAKKKPHNPEAYERALERTADADSFNADALQRMAEDTSQEKVSVISPDDLEKHSQTEFPGITGAATTPSLITSFGDSEVVPDELVAGGAETERRFELAEQIGRGATGRIYAMEDRSLDRTIAVKFLATKGKEKKAVLLRFLHEARVTATLEHPNIMPVYDIGVSDGEHLYFAMKKIQGRSMGEAIRALRKGEVVNEEFATVEGRIRVFLKVCDALTYAHHRGFAHQDVKPDNIMLGEYGEVLLLDWGSAIHTRGPLRGLEKHLHGTPAFMSPEQARRERPDERSDIYCLGASLFQALLLRHPTWAEDPEEFWEKKRRGDIDAMTREERRRVPPALIDIALKAMHRDPDRRYQSVDELARDLKRYQDGLAVEAHRESLLETFGRWYRNNRRVFWLSAASLFVVSVVGGLLFREKIQEWLTWREHFVDSFDYQSTRDLASHWRAISSPNWWMTGPEAFSDSGGWRVEDGALHGYSSTGFHNLTYRSLVPGDMRVQWDVTPARMPLNLNCYIGGEDRLSGYMFHVGSYENSRTCVMTKGDGDNRIDHVQLKRGITVGRTYHFRMEKEGKDIRLFIDGRKIFDYYDPDVLSGADHQTFGFENNNGNHIIIDNLVVYNHPLPLKVSPLATGDRFFERGYYGDALREYRELQEVYPGHEVARSALYKSAKCLLYLDSTEQAIDALLELETKYPRCELTPLATLERGRMLEEQGDTAAAVEVYRQLAVRFPGHAVLRTALFRMTNERRWALNDLRRTYMNDSASDDSFQRWVLAESRFMQDLGETFGVSLRDNLFLSDALLALNSLAQNTLDALIDLFPEQRDAAAEVLYYAGQFERILQEYDDVPEWMAASLVDMGQYREAIRRFPQERTHAARALLHLGRFDDVIEEYTDQIDVCAAALERAGRFDELFERFPASTIRCGLAASRLGVLPEIARRLGWHGTGLAYVLSHYAFRPDSALHVLSTVGGPRPFEWHLGKADALRTCGRVDEVYEALKDVYMQEEVVTHALHVMGQFQEAMDLYPANANVACLSLMEMGDYDAVLRRYPYLVHHCLKARIRQGALDSVRARYARRDSLWAVYYGMTGRLEQLIAELPDQRTRYAEALVRLGRYEQVLADCPEQRNACAQALYATGRAGEALERYPESRRFHARWLIGQKRYEEVVARYPDQLREYGVALAHLGRYAEIPVDHGLLRVDGRTSHDLRLLQVLDAAMRGDMRAAARFRARLPDPNFRWHEHRFGYFLMGPIIRALALDRPIDTEELAALAEKHQRRFGQKLWYEIGYLTGLLSEKQFLEQPFGLWAGDRLLLMRAIAADLQGRHDEALADYRAWEAVPACVIPEVDYNDYQQSLTVTRFVQWRIEQCRHAVSPSHSGDKPATHAAS